MSASIEDTLAEFEPRIDVLSVETFPNFNDNGFSVQLEYEIVGSDDPPTAVELFLARTR